MSGPLSGLRIVEFAGIGPGPFCGMMLADHGAEVVRIDRAAGGRGGSQPVSSKDVLARGRKSIALDLKSSEGVALARKLAAGADGIIEGFRPGVMERLGLGPRGAARRQSEARLRPHDPAGVRPALMRRGLDTTSTTSRLPGRLHISAARAASPLHRSIWSATSAAGG